MNAAHLTPRHPGMGFELQFQSLFHPGVPWRSPATPTAKSTSTPWASACATAIGAPCCA